MSARNDSARSNGVKMSDAYRVLGRLRCPACGRFITTAFARKIVRGNGIAPCCGERVI